MCPNSSPHCASQQPTSLCVPTAHLIVCPNSPPHCVSQQPTSLCVPTAHLIVCPNSPPYCASQQPTSLCIPTAHLIVRPNSPPHCASQQPTSLCVPTAHLVSWVCPKQRRCRGKRNSSRVSPFPHLLHLSPTAHLRDTMEPKDRVHLQQVIKRLDTQLTTYHDLLERERAMTRQYPMEGSAVTGKS